MSRKGLNRKGYTNAFPITRSDRKIAYTAKKFEIHVANRAYCGANLVRSNEAATDPKKVCPYVMAITGRYCSRLAEGVEIAAYIEVKLPAIGVGAADVGAQVKASNASQNRQLGNLEASLMASDVA